MDVGWSVSQNTQICGSKVHTRLKEECEMTRSYLWNDLFTCAASLILECDMTSSCDMVVYVCGVTPSRVWHDCVMWLVCIWNTARSWAWHDSFVRVTWFVQCATWLFSWVWHVSLAHFLSLSHTHTYSLSRALSFSRSLAWSLGISLSLSLSLARSLLHVQTHSLLFFSPSPLPSHFRPPPPPARSSEWWFQQDNVGGGGRAKELSWRTEDLLKAAWTIQQARPLFSHMCFLPHREVAQKCFSALTEHCWHALSGNSEFN